MSTASPTLTPDPGLFGPASQSWRVHADTSMALGGLRALMLQALHPLAMAGVAEHSDFRGDPWGRLFRTAEYIGVITYGTVRDAERAGARVRGIHRRLSGVEPESGTPYRVSDPALLLWVHCCEVDSFLTAYRRAGGEMTDDEADDYLAEQTEAARLVGLDPDSVPDSCGALADYFSDVRPQLRATAAAREAVRFILLPPMPTRLSLSPARPAWAALAAASFGLLPPWARRLYRLPGLSATDLGATATVWTLRTALNGFPYELREGPHVKAARERLSLPPLSAAG